MRDPQQKQPNRSWWSRAAGALGDRAGWWLLVVLMLVALAIAVLEDAGWAVVAILVLLAIALAGAVRSRWAPPAFWREYVQANANLIEHEVDTLRVDRDHPAARAIRQHLQAARRAAERPGDEVPLFRPFLDWWTGASVEAAFLNLHAAEVLLVDLLPEEQIGARIPDLLAYIKTLETRDQHRLAVERLHLDKLGVKLSKLSAEQAAYLGLPVEGPYKSERYRY